MNEWNDVKLCKPEEFTQVLVYIDWGNRSAMSVCYLASDGYWHDNLRPVHTNGSITHWKPLPEPPETIDA